MGPGHRGAKGALVLAAAAALLGSVAIGPSAEAGTGPEGLPASASAGVEARTGWLSWVWCFFGFCGPPPSTTTTSTTSTTVASTTTTAPTTTSTTLPDPGCVTLPKRGGGSWECAFSDEFDGDALDRTRWTPQLTAAGSFDNGRECFVDDPDNIAVTDGALVLTARRESAAVQCPSVGPTLYTSGMVSLRPNGTGGGFAQTYGRYEIRARVTGAKVRGLHEAIWMYPVRPRWTWPTAGEIDIAEIYHRYPDRAVPYVHYNNVLDPNRTNNYCLIDDIWAYHDYVLEWTTESIRILYDGELCLEDRWVPLPPLTGRQPFDEPFYLVLTQALGVGGNSFDPWRTPLPASLVVDHVRIWE